MLRLGLIQQNKTKRNQNSDCWFCSKPKPKHAYCFAKSPCCIYSIWEWVLLRLRHCCVYSMASQLLHLRHVVIALPGLQHPRFLCCVCVKLVGLLCCICSAPNLRAAIAANITLSLGGLWFAGLQAANLKDKRIADRETNPYRL